jgi:AAA+ superfamily predicted ATPase
MAGQGTTLGRQDAHAQACAALDATNAFGGTGDFFRLARRWVALLLGRLVPQAREPGANGPTGSDAAARFAEVTAELQARVQSTNERGLDVPFLRLSRVFRLRDDEANLLLVLFVASLDPEARRLLAVLQGGDERRRTLTGTVLAALANDELPWHLVEPNGTLRWANLVLLPTQERERQAWLLDCPIVIPDAVVAYLARGTAWLDESISNSAEVLTPKCKWDALHWPAEGGRALRLALEMIAAEHRRTGEAAGLVLRGPAGGGKKAAALGFCQKLGARLLRFDAHGIPEGERDASALLRTVARDALLNGGVIYVENAETLTRDTSRAATRLQALRATFTRSRALWLFGTDSDATLAVEKALDLPSVTLPLPDPVQRLALWRTALPGCDGARVQQLADFIAATPGTIARVGADVAAFRAVAPDVEPPLQRMVLARSRHNLRAIADEVCGTQTWDDVVLPDDVRERCRRISELAGAQGALRGPWGLGKKVMGASGVSALFSGPPGAGKTMVAGIIGRDLGLDVFRIDVSRIFSKWVGETEKNLAQVFQEASRTRVLLVFDEADSIFAKRTDVKNASDRYSNVEVNYLLQRMETFDGLVILTTNRESGIDEAFLRRLTFKVRFPTACFDERQELWRRMIPKEIALADNVNLAELARRFDVTGGFIRNAVVRAALISHTERPEQPTLAQHHFLRAIEEELQEGGRLAYQL